MKRLNDSPPWRGGGAADGVVPDRRTPQAAVGYRSYGGNHPSTEGDFSVIFPVSISTTGEFIYPTNAKVSSGVEAILAFD
jgi:hypothetical protein